MMTFERSRILSHSGSVADSFWKWTEDGRAWMSPWSGLICGTSGTWISLRVPSSSIYKGMFPWRMDSTNDTVAIFLYFLKQSFMNKFICKEDEALQRGEDYFCIDSLDFLCNNDLWKYTKRKKMLSLVLFIKEAKSGHIHFKMSFFKYSDLHTFSSQEHLYNSIHSDYIP